MFGLSFNLIVNQFFDIGGTFMCHGDIHQTIYDEGLLCVLKYTSISIFFYVLPSQGKFFYRPAPDVKVNSQNNLTGLFEGK
jgi:hypothetical protein